MSGVLLRFGNCTVDPAARELRRAGELLILSPKVFDCLAYLIAHRDRAVGRDELIAAVWGRTDVSDALLGQAVLKARRAVGDSGDDQQAIRTIPRFGYRWVADVDVGDPLEALPAARIILPTTGVEVDRDASAADRFAVPRPRAYRNRRTILMTAAALIGVLVWVVVQVHRDAPVSPPMATPVHADGDLVAVLPVVVDADAQWSWLRLGLMDLLAVRLAGAGIAVVPSDNIVALVRASSADMQAASAMIRTTTGAHRQLVSTASLTADGWRVHIDLRSDDGVIEAQARNADAVTATRAAVAQLLARLGKRPAPDGSTGPSSLDDLVQRAEAAMLADQLDEARRIIEAAAPDVRNAAELRLRLAQINLRGGRIAIARQGLDRLLADVGAEADPVLRARALTTASSVAFHSGDPQAAARACNEAIALLAERSEPAALGRAYTACGVAAGSAGRFDAAMADFARARVAFEVTGDALSLARVEANEGVMENTRGHPVAAVAVMRRSEERFRCFAARVEVVQTIRNQVDALLALLQSADAFAASERGLALLPQIENADLRHAMQIQRARALAANGRVGEATDLLEHLAQEHTPAQEQSLFGQIRATQAALELATGRAQVAAMHARAAVDAFTNIDDARERARAWLTLVRALRGTDASDAATLEASRFAAWSATSVIAAAPVYSALAEAELRWPVDQAAALASYERAMSAAEVRGVPAEVSAVAISWGAALIDSGDLERASAVVGRIARWADSDFACSLAEARLYHALGHEAPWRAALQRAHMLAGERTIPPAVEAIVVPAPEPPPGRH